MRKRLAVHLIAMAAAAAQADLPEGWLTAVDSNAAARVAKDHANNVARCLWAGENPKVAAALPANAAFQFAIVGSEQGVSDVRDLLEETVAAIPTNLTPVIRRFHLLAPTMQWIVRSVRCKKPGRADYLWSGTHPAAFVDSDFSRDKLLAFARNLSAAQLPPAAVVHLKGEETPGRQPLAPALPGVDYPGVFPEVTYATPFGVGMVVRAPEAQRVFRFRAAAFPASDAPVSFAWTVLTGGAQVQHWDWRHQTKDGYGRIVFSIGNLCARRRIDVAVFARWGEGPWGAPSIISFYISPYEVRTYQKNELVSIRYVPQIKTPPLYDISAICPPADWTDIYQHDEKNRITGFERMMPDGITRENFSDRNEKIVESHPNGLPKVAQKVRYFVKDGKLQYEEDGEPVSYKLETFQPRRWLSRLGSNQD